ncbi:SH3 domain-containing protein [Roseimicrobium sp. ORNL1]|uniref:SH3 domain-containing protein n=1 Tax=Roseimicrobium sp. ORNL1 TaxID=2711231 RepID=UPI0013E14F2F|nr:SH3 domain-containing protein [Roseimicrobium sp. ORNL1]QIF00401.1 SH3 domain-containing protein [Roseimicrobium sp. ORNL1]
MSLKFLPHLLLALLVCTSPAQTAEPSRKLMPVDEAVKNPSFFLFRAKLQEAVAKKDAAYVLGVIAPDIQTGFDGENGSAAFKKKWNLEKPDEASELWPLLARTLAMGGKFDKDGSFQAPYTSAAWPEEFDSFEHTAVVGENVRVREKADAQSAVVATLSFEVVALAQSDAPQEERQPWVKVKLPNGREGYIRQEYVSMAIGFRAYFEKKNGSWVMTAFLAGD